MKTHVDIRIRNASWLKSVLGAAILAGMVGMGGGLAWAAQFDWWGNVYIPLSQDDLKLIGRQDLKWGNPENWLVDGRPATGRVPGSHEDDVVVIRAVGSGPEDPSGRIAELHVSGNRAVLGSSNPSGPLRIRSRVLLDSIGDWGTFTGVHLTIEETARMTFRGQNNIASSFIENYGVIEATEEGAWLVGGQIENHFGIALQSGTIMGPTLVNNLGYLSKIDTGGVTRLRVDLTNAPSGTIQVKGGTLHLESGLLSNAGTILVEGGPESTLKIQGLGAPALLQQWDGGQTRGPGSVHIVSSLEVLGNVSMESVLFGDGQTTGVLRGPGRLTVTRGIRVRGGGAWLEGTYDSAKNQLVDVSPILELAPGAECVLEAEALLGRRFENHGRIVALAGLGITSDTQGGQALLVNHPDGVYEGLPPGRQWGGWSLGACTNAGQMTFRGGGQGYGQITFTNSGTLRVVDGDFKPQNLFQRGGNLDISSRAYVSVYGRCELWGGLLSGGGTLQFVGADPGIIDCVIRPGSSPGMLTVHGVSSAAAGTTLGSNAVVEIEMGGRTAGVDYDQLISEGGYLGMNGTLRVVLRDAFVPSVGDKFKVLQYGAIGWFGRFERIEVPELPGGLRFDARYEPDGLQLVVVEPLTVTVSLGGDGKFLDLSWPAGSGRGAVIESTDSLDPPRWQVMDSPVVEREGRMHGTVSVDASQAPRFFRLRATP